MKTYRIVWMMVLAGAFTTTVGCRRENEGSSSAAKIAQISDSDRCPHQIKKDKCPFCTPSLVTSQGFCGEHGVAEALCYQCRPFLKTAFRAKGDWCKTHDVPESQCVQCHPELKSKARPGSGHGTAVGEIPSAAIPGACSHGIDPEKCPFCKPELIQSEGFCKEHDVAEALCVQCRSYLVTAFKAAGDWCSEHDVPESQCALCNPSLKDKKP